MRAAGVLCVFALPYVARAETLARAELEALFGEGNYLFRQATERVRTDPDAARELYGRAALRFRRIVEQGDVHNGRLYYNIGNAYFRMEDLGRAILYYRRAAQYIPDDLNLAQNLKYARRRRLDKIEEREKTKVLKTLFFWHYDLSSRSRVLLFCVAFVPLWFLAAVRLFRRSVWGDWVLVVLALLAVLLFGSLVVEWAGARRERPGVVLSPQVVARKGDSETYEPSFTEPLHAGTEFVLMQERGSWYQIRLMDGRRCWVPARATELVR